MDRRNHLSLLSSSCFDKSFCFIQFLNEKTDFTHLAPGLFVCLFVVCLLLFVCLFVRLFETAR